MNALNVAMELYLQAKDRQDDLDKAHWLATPDKWMEIRADRQSDGIVQISGRDTQSLLGIPLRIGLPGTVPAIDLIVE